MTSPLELQSEVSPRWRSRLESIHGNASPWVCSASSSWCLVWRVSVMRSVVGDWVDTAKEALKALWPSSVDGRCRHRRRQSRASRHV